MRMIALIRRLAARTRLEDGFTLIIALGVMLVTSLLLVAAFTATTGDVHLAYEDLTQKQAYFAAQAGVQAYEYQLQKNPDFWQSCESLSASLPQEEHTKYEVTLLAKTGEPKGTTCSKAAPFETVIESSGRAANTFRVLSTGYAGKDKRSIIATFQVKGFLDYVYFTHFEEEDPSLNNLSLEKCSVYHKEREERREKEGLNCGSDIEFAPADSVKGPMHTDDAALVCGETTFGRKEHSPADTVQINFGTYSNGCGSNPKFYSKTGSWEVGEELIPPEQDTSLGAYVESGYEFEGVTTLNLEGSKVTVTNANYNGGKAKQIPLPKNGLIWVHSQEKPACEYKYEQEPADTPAEVTKEVPCGTVYVKGNYSEALTIGAEKEIVIKGSITPTGVTPPASGESPSGTPPGTATLGLIASEFIRMYNPCNGGNAEGPTNPWVYAAILSTAHSFLVDNFACRGSLGTLNIDGAIAQNFRGVVGTTGNTGYLKNYNYDERLATDEPPYFLAPLKAGWKIGRETAPGGG